MAHCKTCFCDEKDCMLRGSITANGKTYAVAGGPDAGDRAKRALGTMSPIVGSVPSAPLPFAPLAPSAAEAEKEADKTEKPAPKSEPPKLDPGATPDAAAETSPADLDRAIVNAKAGRFGGAEQPKGSKWAMVRAPKAPAVTKSSFLESADAARK